MNGIYEFKQEDAFAFSRDIGIRTKKVGDELQFKTCPYCKGGQTPDHNTFSINLKTGQFKCLRSSCNAHGNMITLSKDFNFSLGRDADAYYNSIGTFKSFREKKAPEAKPEAIRYLLDRGIPEEITKQYHITVQTKNDSILVFPFLDTDGAIQFIKYRNTKHQKGKGSKEWCEANCKPILFGMDQCDPENKTLVMTEGQIDSLSCAAAGIKNAVSVPTGCNGFTWVPYCWDFLTKYDKLIIFGDYERGKITLLSEMEKRFTHGAVYHVREENYKDCKDANELLQRYGAEAVREAVENAVPIPNKHIESLDQIKRVDMASLERFPSGFRSIDKILGGLFFGQLILLTGERGQGKSTLGSQIGLQAIKAGYSTMYYSGELLDWYFRDWFDRQVAGKEHINTIWSNLGYATYSVDGACLDQMEAWYRGKAYLYCNRIVQQDGEEETLLQTLENSIKQYGCRCLIIDNLMTAMTDDIKSDLYRQQTGFVGSLATMARSYNVLIILIAHPRKSTGGEFGNDDIMGSSNITNLCDVVMRYTHVKDTPDEDRVIQIFKNRLNGRINREGVPVYFQESSKRISEDSNNFNLDLGWEQNSFIPIKDDDVIFD